MKLWAALVIIATLTSACVARLDSGDPHQARYLVIGLGLVWVKDSAPEAAAVSGVKALGVTVSDRPGLKVAVGYTDSFTVTVPDAQANIVVNVSQKPGGGAEVEAGPAKGQGEEEDQWARQIDSGR